MRNNQTISGKSGFEKKLYNKAGLFNEFE